jgi:hypothetical protein
MFLKGSMKEMAGSMHICTFLENNYLSIPSKKTCEIVGQQNGVVRWYLLTSLFLQNEAKESQESDMNWS